MYQDFKDLLPALNAHRVKYLIIRGYAVALHAQPRATQDLDLEIREAADSQRAVAQRRPSKPVQSSPSQ